MSANSSHPIINFNSSFKISPVKNGDQTAYSCQYQAKIGDKTLSLRVLLPENEMEESAFNQTIQDVAVQGMKMIAETSSDNVSSVSYENDQATIDQTEWNSDHSTLTTKKITGLSGRVFSFTVEVAMDAQEGSKIASLYHESTGQSDIDQFLHLLTQSWSNFTSHELWACLTAFQKIADPSQRKNLLQSMEKESFKNSCGLLAIALSQNANTFAESLLPSIKITNLQDTGIKGRSLLDFACDNRSISIPFIKQLLTHPEVEVTAENCKTAIRYKRHDLLKELFQSGKVSDPNPILQAALRWKKKGVLKDLLKLEGLDINKPNEAGWTPLQQAVNKENVDALITLLKDPRIQINQEVTEDLPPLYRAYENDDVPEMLSAFLDHPEIDISILLNEFIANPHNFKNNNFDVLKEAFPEKVEAWLNAHPEMKIGLTIIDRKIEGAQSLLTQYFEAGAPLNIIRLLQIDDSILPFIRDHFHPGIIKWLLDSGTLDRLTLEDQRYVMRCVDPQFSEYMDTKGILAHKGIEVIIKELRKKNSLPLEDCITVCQDRAQFTKSLKALAENSDIPDGYCHFFIVTKVNENPHGLGAHVTPIFLRKEAGKWEAVITDSTTDEDNVWDDKSSCKPLVDRLQNAEAAANGKLPIRHIHVNSFWRQADSFSCPIFAVRDLVYFYRKGKEFLNALNDRSDHSQVHRFSHLPPEMMKTTQSISDITKYAENKTTSQLTMKRNKTQEDETLLENLERHKQKTSKGIRNTLITERAEKYQKLVLKHRIDEIKVEHGWT